MHNDIKTAKYYSPAKMTRAIMMMEQFWILSQTDGISADDKKCAKGLFEHYRRLAMCILMKEFPQEMTHDLIIDVDFMKNLYKKYTL